MPVLMAGRDRPAQRALALGGLGDVALLGSGETAFMAGLGCFLLATWPGSPHCGNSPAGAACAPGQSWLRRIVARVRRGKRLPVEAHRQEPHPGRRLQRRAARDVPGGAGFGLVADGRRGALFLASDTLLALEKFGLHLPAHEGLVMATCTSAQALLASDEAVA